MAPAKHHFLLVGGVEDEDDDIYLWREITVECNGVTDACRMWMICMDEAHDHAAPDQAVPHEEYDGDWFVATETCAFTADCDTSVLDEEVARLGLEPGKVHLLTDWRFEDGMLAEVDIKPHTDLLPAGGLSS